MGDDLERKRQRLIAEYEHLVQRKEYERQMQLADDFAYSNGHITHVNLELSRVEQELREIDQTIKERK